VRGSSRRPLLDSNRILSLLRISSTIISVDGSGSALQLALDYCQLMSTMVVLKRRGNLDLSISPEASFVSQLSDETSIDRTSRTSRHNGRGKRPNRPCWGRYPWPGSSPCFTASLLRLQRSLRPPLYLERYANLKFSSHLCRCSPRLARGFRWYYKKCSFTTPKYRLSAWIDA